MHGHMELSPHALCLTTVLRGGPFLKTILSVGGGSNVFLQQPISGFTHVLPGRHVSILEITERKLLCTYSFWILVLKK